MRARPSLDMKKEDDMMEIGTRKRMLAEALNLDTKNSEWDVFRSLVDTRHDWHEPDEQGLSAIVTGTILDNAMGDRISHELDIIKDNPGTDEIRVHIRKDDSHFCSLNLATLLAVAQVGLEEIMSVQNDSTEKKIGECLRMITESGYQTQVLRDTGNVVLRLSHDVMEDRDFTSFRKTVDKIPLELLIQARIFVEEQLSRGG